MNPFAKHVCKDPQGYVPTNFATTTKKLKSLGVNNHMMAQALKSSSKLEKEKEELQFHFSPFESCTVIAENLPDDHSHQNIEKIFSVIGSIKTIRICQPQKPSSSRSSKGDSVVSHKLHALVEYENPETAERAILFLLKFSIAKKLNDEKNGRKGMRVRVLLKRTVNVHPKSVLKNTKSGFDGYLDDDDDGLLHLLHKDASRLNVSESNRTEQKSKTRNEPSLLAFFSLLLRCKH
ncbi:hypothetical protein ACJIZ3_003558 [Penstemon smallii]|uniref:RRM domain-containing protein n=1 Tax=Penstemon smallii TaxID=265156 RepID=A0ABD3TPK7_9LAMI